MTRAPILGRSSGEVAAMNARLEEEKIDITLPGRVPKTGHIHPLTTVNEMIEDFFMKMGYTCLLYTSHDTEFTGQTYHREAVCTISC